MARNNKHYSFIPRWKIEVELTTTSFLHIGGNEIVHRDNLEVEQQDGSKQADITGFAKDSCRKPYIPGSTIKGNTRQWLISRSADGEAARLVNTLLGSPAVGEEQGCGGAAEFYNGVLSHTLTDGQTLPYWDQQSQTCVETSTVIDRATGTVVDKKLFHLEVVPPGVGFRLTITGAISRSGAALLAAVLKRGWAEDCRDPIILGAETSNGRGRLKLENLQMSVMDRQQVQAWIREGAGDMAARAMRKLTHAEVEQLIATGQGFLADPGQTPYHISINLQFSGPFLVNDPSRCLDNQRGDPVHKPLRDTNGHPRLPAASFRGVLRSQAEKIIRTLGGRCCDPANPCPAVYTVEEAETSLCLACRLFGATGWKSRISIEKIRFIKTEPAPDGSLEHQQDFVAIDRFHGGGKDTSKFKAAFTCCPFYSIDLAVAPDCTPWEKRLLALTLRDLQEGDITCGLGKARGYGRINTEQTTISGDEFLRNANPASLQDLCREIRQEYPCASRPVPQTKEPMPLQTSSGDRQAGQQFHNPYHFVPIRSPETTSWLNKDDLGPAMHDSHALYRESDQSDGPLYHGRINCTLTTQTPTFIGGTRNGGQPEQVEHYKENGKVAIPATTLRGLISSQAEAASNSSLRVLDDTLLSYRQPVGKDNLSAIGMVITRNGNYFLYPLALPTFDQQQGLPEEYRIMFPCRLDEPAPLKVYLENAYQTGTMKNFLDERQSWNLRHPEIYYLPVPVFHFNAQGKMQYRNMGILKRKTTRNCDLLFGACLEGNPCPVGQRESDEYLPGILRILGKEGRYGDMPNTKKHELFIPVPDDFAENPKQFIDTLPPEMLFEIPESVVAVFEELADQRTKPQIKHPENVGETQWLPYHLKGCSRNNGLTGENAQKLRLQHGDLVYFRPFSRSPRMVAEISFSSVWRSRVSKKVHKFFPAELRPFNRERKVISPAELLFGFVQLDAKEENNLDKKKLSFAGKVQISPARLDREQATVFMEQAATLKILASPKPPSPSLYFKGSNYIAKTEMNDSDVQPQGRKQYLHALPNADDPQGVRKLSRTGHADSAGRYPWKTRHQQDSLQQKMQVTPLKKGVSFSFTVEFENCTAWELGLLLYSLRPTEEYRHKIGMGKPIGLGTVKIDVDELQLINRKQRYSMDTLTTDRYNQTMAQSLEESRALFADTMEPDIRHALELLGNPDNVRFPVHYPQVKGKDIEKETFLWFVDNDMQRNEYLEPLPAASGQLPVLTRKDKI